MASRVAEVIYRLKDLFSGPSKKVEAGYSRIRRSSKQTADSVARDGTRIDKGLRGIEGGIGRLIGGWRGLAAAVTGGTVVNSFKSIIDEADKVGKAAEKINLTSEALSKLAFAAERSGVGFNSLEIGLQRMERRIGDALNGSTELQKTFAQLGLDVAELAGLSADQAFLRIADAVKQAGSETEQLSLFVKIFDSEAANLIRVAKLGSEGIRELGDEAERLGKVFGGEFTQNAAKFNDLLTDLEARVSGVKINAFTPVLEELVEFFDNVGLGDKVTGLTTELLGLEKLLADPFLFNRSGVERRIAEITTELKRLSAERETAKKVADEERETLAKSQAANAAYGASVVALTDKYKMQLDVRKKTLAEETAELSKARAEQKGIEAEFRSLVDSITRPESKDVFLLDVFEAIRKSKFALDSGEIEAAIDQARVGGDLLGALKDKGTETQGTLTFLAKQLQTVATEAAKKRTDTELVDVEAAKASFDAITQQAKILKDTAPAAGSEYARAFLDAMRAEFAATVLPAPQVAAPVVPAPAGQAEAGEPATRIVREGNTFYRTALDKAGAK